MVDYRRRMRFLLGSDWVVSVACRRTFRPQTSRMKKPVVSRRLMAIDILYCSVVSASATCTTFAAISRKRNVLGEQSWPTRLPRSVAPFRRKPNTALETFCSVGGSHRRELLTCGGPHSRDKTHKTRSGGWMFHDPWQHRPA